MSYNILSQELLQDNRYLYGHCDPAHLSWDYRLPNLLAELQHLDADVSPAAQCPAHFYRSHDTGECSS